MPARAPAWWPLTCAALAAPGWLRRARPAGIALALAGIARAWMTAPHFERTPLWPG